MSSQPPIVSVCMAAFNTAPYVAAAIESALSQTLSDVEVIVLDNASIDGTAAVIAGFSDPRLRPLTAASNLGAAGGRAHVIDQARGEWIAVLDSDDWMAPDRLERLVTLGGESDAEIVADDVHLIDDGAEHPWGTLFTAGYEGLNGVRNIDATTFVESDRWLQPGLRLGLTKPLVRGSFLREHPELRPDPELTVVHDYWWVLEALLAGARFTLTPEPGYYYRAREGQMVTSGIELDTLHQQVDMATRVLARPDVQADPEFSAALIESRRLWAEASAYLRFLDALRSRNVRAAIRLGRRHPSAIRTTLANGPAWLGRKFTGDRFTTHMTRRF